MRKNVFEVVFEVVFDVFEVKIKLNKINLFIIFKNE